jgi:2-polyprenyl-3-methyl-5-hydroxy-6-metoxy-1,4-benzoquinol methylase
MDNGENMTAKEYLEKHWNKNKIWTHLLSPVHQKRLKYCADTMQGENFVDIGCGAGHSTNIMKGFHPGNWTGIDFCDITINNAKKIFSNINFISLESVSKLNDLEPYDGVVCSEVIEHVENDLELVNALYNITKKITIITTPSIKVDDPGHLRVYNEKSLKQLFNNISNTTIKQDGKFFYICLKKN